MRPEENKYGHKLSLFGNSHLMLVCNLLEIVKILLTNLKRYGTFEVTSSQKVGGWLVGGWCTFTSSLQKYQKH